MHIGWVCFSQEIHPQCHSWNQDALPQWEWVLTNILPCADPPVGKFHNPNNSSFAALPHAMFQMLCLIMQMENCCFSLHCEICTCVDVQISSQPLACVISSALWWRWYAMWSRPGIWFLCIAVCITSSPVSIKTSFLNGFSLARHQKFFWDEVALSNNVWHGAGCCCKKNSSSLFLVPLCYHWVTL